MDIVTDTLRASSSDLITWNTLVMLKLQWIDKIPRQWIEITTQSLEAWKVRDDTHPFLPDNRRGYARVTPVALSKVGVPNSSILVLEDYPQHGLGLYEDLESWEQYSGYVWDNWTTKAVQPVHIDPALQAMIDHSSQPSASVACQSGHDNAHSSPNTLTGLQGSYASASPYAPPFPDSVEDVSMEPPADKRSRESPDSTLKPQGKSLKTSGVATATSAESVTPSACAVHTSTCDEGKDAAPEIPTIRWRAREVAETRFLMRQLQNRMPAWKLKTCIEILRTTPVHLAMIGEVTGIQFGTVELVKVAVQCLDEIASEADAANSTDTSVAAAAVPSHDDKQTVNDKSDFPEPENEPKISVEESADKSESHKEPAEQCATAQGSSMSRLRQHSIKMPQHHVMGQTSRVRVVLRRIHLRIGLPAS